MLRRSKRNAVARFPRGVRIGGVETAEIGIHNHADADQRDADLQSELRSEAWQFVER